MIFGRKKNTFFETRELYFFLSSRLFCFSVPTEIIILLRKRNYCACLLEKSVGYNPRQNLSPRYVLQNYRRHGNLLSSKHGLMQAHVFHVIPPVKQIWLLHKHIRYIYSSTDHFLQPILVFDLLVFC